MRQVTVGTGFQRLGLIFAGDERRRDLKNGYMGRLRIPLDLLADIKAGGIGQMDIQNDQRGQGSGSAPMPVGHAGVFAFIAGLVEDAPEYISILFPVVGDQDARGTIFSHWVAVHCSQA